MVAFGVAGHYSEGRREGVDSKDSKEINRQQDNICIPCIFMS
jgi:hypothetical protein